MCLFSHTCKSMVVAKDGICDNLLLAILQPSNMIVTKCCVFFLNVKSIARLPQEIQIIT